MSNLTDPVFWENVDDQADLERIGIKTLTDWIARLHYQRAPAGLITPLTEVRDKMQQVHDALKELQPYFPKQVP